MLQDVQFVLDLAPNLNNVRQLVSSGYFISFDNNACTITDKKTGKEMAIVCKPKNSMFLVELSDIGNYSLTMEANEDTKLWIRGMVTSILRA